MSRGSSISLKHRDCFLGRGPVDLAALVCIVTPGPIVGGNATHKRLCSANVVNPATSIPAAPSGARSRIVGAGVPERQRGELVVHHRADLLRGVAPQL